MTAIDVGPPLPRRMLKQESRAREVIERFRQSRVAVFASAVLALLIAAAILAPWIVPQNPYDLGSLSIIDGRLPPGTMGSEGFKFWLGTDDKGRDMLSAILYGLRTSLYVGVLSTCLALAFGSAFGLIAAYNGGVLDTIVSRLVDIQLSFPSILVALLLVALLGQGTDKVVLALVSVQWAYYARTVRASAIVEREKEYIEAAKGLGLSRLRIVYRHLLPNCLAPLIVVATVQIAHAIALEATLSFLGIGLPVTQPSLGLLISNGFQYMLSGSYWISIFPGLALLILILPLNLVADQLRDVLNPRHAR